jgi:DNA-binding MarR family transcriptional regulator
MSDNYSVDPRDALVRRKFFSLRPQPLEQWIWRQRIAASAERVFWLHWHEGMRNRDWCSSLPLRRVATLCALDVSSVTRAYQQLVKLGLIRRQDPGRDPAQPFSRAICITEVRIPRELFQLLGTFPDRTPRAPAADSGATPIPAQGQTAPVTAPVEAAPCLNRQGTEPAPFQPASLADPFKGLSGRERQRALSALLGQLSDGERRRYQEAMRSHDPVLVFDPDSQLVGSPRNVLLQILQIAASRPSSRAEPIVARIMAPEVASNGRPLSLVELALLRRQLQAISGTGAADDLARQVAWSIEKGALSRFTALHAIRIALKKIRQGAWTRPNRMPPNWARGMAHSDICRAA